MMNHLSLYIHIPFCVRKCNYCDFLSAPCDDKTKQKYVEALCREITQKAENFKNKKVDTIFFGGGTPSLLTIKQIETIILNIRQVFHVLPDAEITLEMNPGTVDREKLEIYQRLGINRLSIGLQSANNEELRILGRIHTWETFLNTWEMVREVGFTNVNIDLMSALPGQTLESYDETLRKVLALKPEHISAYSLIVEEGTPFYEWFGEENEIKQQIVPKDENEKIADSDRDIMLRKLPDEDIERRMYEVTKELLEKQGYCRYEISNYALNGYECKHNIGYWRRKEYLGLGLGAASLLSMDSDKPCGVEVTGQLQQDFSCKKNRNIRCRNTTDMETYVNAKWGSSVSGKEQDKEYEGIETFGKEQDWMEEFTELSEREKIEEFMFLGLRMMEGILPTEFEEQFGKTLQNVYGKQIQKLVKQGLLEYQEKTDRYALTLQGIDVSNQVFVEFIE